MLSASTRKPIKGQRAHGCCACLAAVRHWHRAPRAGRAADSSRVDASIEFDLARHCFKGRLDDNSKAPALITQLRSGLRLSVTVAAFNKAAASVRHRDITNRASGLPDVGGWFCRDIAGCSSVARFKSDIIAEAAWGPKLPSRCGSHGPGPRPSNEPALSALSNPQWSNLAWPLDARCGRTMASKHPAHYRNGPDGTRVPICDRNLLVAAF